MTGLPMPVLYHQYIRSSTWKCRKSPTRAHYYVGDRRLMICKYCGVKKIPVDWNDVQRSHQP